MKKTEETLLRPQFTTALTGSTHLPISWFSTELCSGDVTLDIEIIQEHSGPFPRIESVGV